MRDRLYEIMEQHRKKPQSVSILQFSDDLFSQMFTLSASIAKAEKHIDEKIQKHKTDNPNK